MAASPRKSAAVAVLGFIAFLATASQVGAEEKITAGNKEAVLVYPSIALTVNKSIVLHLPKKATKVFVTQPKIAEIVVVAPDQLLIHGKAVGSTSLVVWTEGPIGRKE